MRIRLRMRIGYTSEEKFKGNGSINEKHIHVLTKMRGFLFSVVVRLSVCATVNRFKEIIHHVHATFSNSNK